MHLSTMTRKEFLHAVTATGCAALAGMLMARRGRAQEQEVPKGTDINICNTCLKVEHRSGSGGALIGELVVSMGRRFVGRPYKEHTLDELGGEHLVINLREFDCVTLCETSLALARAVKFRMRTFDGYCRQLQLIRYRSGIINGYGSRLHYFTDWAADNQQKGIVRNVTEDLGGIRDRRVLNYMTSHRDAYPRLVSHDDFIKALRSERELSATRRWYIPKRKIPGILSSLRNGDIVAMTTSVKGLDVSHTGIVVNEEGGTKLLHASMTGESVLITRESLYEYLIAHTTQTGIVVVRPVDPA